VNGAIRAKEVRVVAPDGEQIGVKKLNEALWLAAQAAAARGQILVTQTGRDRTGVALEYAPGDLYELKGLLEPVALYAVA
jgi:hypothetical protein